MVKINERDAAKTIYNITIKSLTVQEADKDITLYLSSHHVVSYRRRDEGGVVIFDIYTHLPNFGDLELGRVAASSTGAGTCIMFKSAIPEQVAIAPGSLEGVSEIENWDEGLRSAHGAFVDLCNDILDKLIESSALCLLGKWLLEKIAMPTEDGADDVGRPELSHNELIYRLAKAQEAEEIREARCNDNGPGAYWKEIAKEIQWNKGTSKSGLALLRDARHRLRRLRPDDPLLEEVAEHRAKAKETKRI